MRSVGGWIAAGGGWFAGTVAQMQQAGLWTPTTYLAWGLAAAAGLAAASFVAWTARGAPISRSGPWRGARGLAIGVACALLAHSTTGWRAAQRLADRLDPALEGRDLVLTGLVASLPHDRSDGSGFVFEVNSAHLAGEDAQFIQPGRGRVPGRLRLGWYGNWAGGGSVAGQPQADEAAAAWVGARPALAPGQHWQLTVRLRQPQGLLNPHGYDVELAWFEQGIRALGTVREAGAAPPRLLAPASPWTTPGLVIEHWRHRVRAALYARLPDAAQAGLLAALTLGDQAAILPPDWDLFRVTGVAHLMAISGLHVTLFAWLAGAGIGALWRRHARLASWLPAPMAQRVGGLLAATLYALFAGWALPAQRTVCMLAVGSLPALAGLTWPWPAVWAASGLVVLLLDPWAVLSAGFWLSFGAVGLLLLADRAADDRRRGATDAPEPTFSSGTLAALRAGLGQLSRAQVVATVGLAPLSLLFFNQLSVVGLAANLVAIPWVSFVVTPLALLGVVLAPAWDLAAWALDGLRAGLQVLATLPGATWSVAAAPLWAQAAGLAAGALAVAPLPWRWRVLAVPLGLPLLMPPVPMPGPGDFEVVAADVGQGTAVLVRTARHLLVYDTGPLYGPGSVEEAAGRRGATLTADAGRRVLLPLLRARGEGAIDRLVLSHGDADHVGGAASLLAGWPVRDLLSSLPADHPLLAQAPRHQPCAAGQAWTWDGVRFELLHPLPGAVTDRASSANNLSCVLKVSAAGGSVLLTGDIDRADEARLLARLPRGSLHADVLFVPHHGSRTSSSPAFLDAVGARVAVVQAGYRNRYGHPAPDVLARLSARGARVVQTPSCGAWIWRTESDRAGAKGHDPAVKGAGPGPRTVAAGTGRCWRESSRRYWHAGSTVQQLP